MIPEYSNTVVHLADVTTVVEVLKMSYGMCTAVVVDN